MDFKKLKVPQLKDYMRENRISGFSKMRKSELIEACVTYNDRIRNHNFDENPVYFKVEEKKEEEARQCGGEYDRRIKRWYANSAISYLQMVKLFKVDDPIVKIIGEDREFGGDELFVDMIPRSSWYHNLRSYIKRRDWERIRKYVCERVENKCECCGCDEEKNGRALDCHERWEYDESKGSQKLMRLVALCQRCHEVTHIGYAEIKGRMFEAYTHLKTVRNFTDNECEIHIRIAYYKWLERNMIAWKLDLSVLDQNNIKYKI